MGNKYILFFIIMYIPVYSFGKFYDAKKINTKKQNSDILFYFQLSYKSKKYYIDPINNALLTGKKKIIFSSISNSCCIQHVQYTFFNNDFVIVFVHGIVDDVTAVIVRVDNKTLKLKWEQNINGFNIGPPLIDEHYLYLTSYGYICKLNLIDGKIIWQYKNLVDKNNIFWSFQKPFVRSNYVFFLDNDNSLKGKNNLSYIVVNKNTGKIVKIIRMRK